MRSYWLRRENNPTLIVFALGWAADHRVVAHAVPEGCDAVCLYDYRDFTADALADPSFPQNLPSAAEVIGQIALPIYETRCLVAWSFGVWAAERLFGGSRVRFDRLVAFNGTPLPVNESYGIEPRRLAVTIRGLSSGGMDAFNRRAYADAYDRFSELLSPRSLDENVSELVQLQASAALEYSPLLEWDVAVVGSGDEIFAPRNMLAYWGARSKILPLPHYPFADGRIIERELWEQTSNL